MTTREPNRTPFGARLAAARKHAGLSQGALAKAVGMAQSTLAEAERIANGSAKTTLIAAKTGVDAHWLATGQGSMLPHVRHLADSEATYQLERAKPANAPTPLNPTQGIYQVIQSLGALLAEQDHLSRLSIAPLLQRLAEHPEETEDIARQVQRSLTNGGNEPPASSTSPAHSVAGGRSKARK